MGIKEMTKGWTAVVFTALLAVCAFLANRYLALRDEFSAYRASVETAGKLAQAAQEKLKTEYAKHLEEIRNEHEKRLGAVMADSRAAYDERLRVELARAHRVRGAAAGQPMDDGAVEKRLLDSTLGNAAEDALKLAAWQEWCKKNGCPVE